MVKRKSLARTLALSGMVAGLLASPLATPLVTSAWAQDATAQAPAAPAKKKVRTKVAAKPGAKVVVPKGKIQIDNKRLVTLSELTITPAGAAPGAPIVVARDLGSGQKILATLPKKAGCVFTLSGSFDDESSLEVPAQNLCKDPTINLVE